MLIGVLARNMNEFWYHVKELCPEPKRIRWANAEITSKENDQYFFINSASRIRGLRAFRMVRVGNWHMRPDNDEIDFIHKSRLFGSGIPSEKWEEYGALK